MVNRKRGGGKKDKRCCESNEWTQSQLFESGGIFGVVQLAGVVAAFREIAKFRDGWFSLRNWGE